VIVAKSAGHEEGKRSWKERDDVMPLGRSLGVAVNKDQSRCPLPCVAKSAITGADTCAAYLQETPLWQIKAATVSDVLCLQTWR